jgi:hypothetical protein
MTKFTNREQHICFINSPLDVSSKIKFGKGQVYEYRRTSTGHDDDHYEMNRPANRNTIIASNVSAFNREDICDLIFFLVNNGSRNFIFKVVDETRFTRNTVAALKIRDFLISKKTSFSLVIGDEKYDYVDDFYTHLRPKFITSEASSIEKSRISRMAHSKKKKLKKLKDELRTYFINMMFVIGGGLQGAIRINERINVLGMSIPKLGIWYKKHLKEIKRLKKQKDYYYTKCSYYGFYFICPPSLAERKDLCSTYVGIDNSIRSYFSNKKISYLCCSGKTKFVNQADIDFEMEEDDDPTDQEKEWLVEVFTQQHAKGEITLQELTEKMQKLFE